MTQRRSAAAKVLIGLGIAVAFFVILGILAAIAIPVFLNQRQKANRNVVLPSTLVNQSQLHSSDLDTAATAALSTVKEGIGGLTQGQASYYGTADRPAFVVAAAKLPSPPSAANERTFFGFIASVDHFTTPLQPTTSGPHGGAMECGQLALSGGKTASACYSLDTAAVVVVVGLRMTPEQTAVLTRQVIGSVEVKH